MHHGYSQLFAAEYLWERLHEVLYVACLKVWG